MSAIHEMLSWPVAQRLGWLVVSFIWQGTAIAALLAVARFAQRRASANSRYLAACAALALMAACPLATSAWLAAKQPIGSDQHAMMNPSLTVAAIQTQPVSSEDFVGNTNGKLQHPEPPASVAIVHSAQTNVAPDTSEFQQTQWISLLAVGWIVGVFLLSLRLMMGARRVWQLRRQAIRVPAGQLQSALVRLVDHFHINWPVELAESALVEVPTVIGWLKPIVLLPATAISGLSIEQLEGLLAHEIAHIRRHDYLVNLVQTAIETLLFYHPAVWWVSSCIRQEREHCCDDMAVAVCGNRLAYARSLMTLEELRVAVGPLALAAGGGRLMPRIRRIVGAPAAARCAAGYWLAGALLITLSIMIVVQLTHSAQAAGDEPPKATSQQEKPPSTNSTNNAATPAQEHDATAIDATKKSAEEDGKKSSTGEKTEAGTLPVVEVIHPVVREVYDHQDYNGFVMPMQKVELRARVSGQLEAVKVNSGDLVKQGDLLFQLDDARYKAEVDKAQANVRIAKAALKTGQFEVDNANSAVAKVPSALTQQELSRLNGQRDEIVARVEASEAEYELARLNLAATRIVAPINGRIGKIELDVGSIVKADDTVLATISSVDPVYIGFWMDQATLIRLQAAQRAGKFKFADAPVLFQIGNEDKGYPYKAKLVGGAFEVDSKTNASMLRAVAPNADESLIPGMFVRIRLPISNQPFQTLIVPKSAVRQDNKGFGSGTSEGSSSVYVVNTQDIIEPRRIVTVIREEGGMAVIKTGIKKEDLVVVDYWKAERLFGSKLIGAKVEPKLVTPSEEGKALK